MTDSQRVWKSRIVGEDEVAPDQLMAHHANFRRHSRVQQEAMGAALDDIGWVQRILVSKRTGTVLDGHMRVEMAIREEVPTVPVTYVDVTEEEEKKILATFDPLGGMAYIDRDQLRELALEVDFTDDALQSLHEALLFEAESGTDAGELGGGEGDKGHEYEGEGDPDWWPRLAIKLPHETRNAFIKGAEEAALEHHEYLLLLLENMGVVDASG